jgi:2-desacetyl-2-hydroxyethyl bacteriochlorophyllide A dehydrogenase
LPQKSRALQFVAPRRIDIVDVDLPEVGAGEVMIRTLYSGISSGTELLAYRGELDPSLPLDETIDALDGTFSYPFPYGYSCVGRVERSSGEVPEGTLAFVLHPHQDRFVTSAANVVPVDGLEPRQATLFPLVETAFQIAMDAGPRIAEPVVVMGLGAVGLLTAALLHRAGADVLAVEPRDWRRKVAASAGLEPVHPDDVAGEVDERTGGRGVPLVIEASGDPAVLAAALPLMAHEGTALVASWYGTKEAVLPLGAEFHRRRLSIRSTQVSSIPARLAHRWTFDRRRDAVRRLLAELPLAELATHEFPFGAAQEAFAAVDEGREGLIHAVLAYQ